MTVSQLYLLNTVHQNIVSVFSECLDIGVPESTVAANETVVGMSHSNDFNGLIADAESTDVLSNEDGDISNVDMSDEAVAVCQLRVLHV